jgi:hypothetical protein
MCQEKTSAFCEIQNNVAKYDINYCASATEYVKRWYQLTVQMQQYSFVIPPPEKKLPFSLRAKKVLGVGCSSAVPNRRSYNPNSHHPLPPTPPLLNMSKDDSSLLRKCNWICQKMIPASCASATECVNVLKEMISASCASATEYVKIWYQLTAQVQLNMSKDDICSLRSSTYHVKRCHQLTAQMRLKYQKMISAHF